jgi:hypothetical protein
MHQLWCMLLSGPHQHCWHGLLPSICCPALNSLAQQCMLILAEGVPIWDDQAAPMHWNQAAILLLQK